MRTNTTLKHKIEHWVDSQGDERKGMRLIIDYQKKEREWDQEQRRNTESNGYKARLTIYISELKWATTFHSINK